jgi:hypothetical protein
MGGEGYPSWCVLQDRKRTVIQYYVDAIGCGRLQATSDPYLI